MSQSIALEGEIEVIKPQGKTGEGGISALAVDAETEHGILDIDLRQYAKVGHTHDEFIRKGEAADSNLRVDVLFNGNAKTRDASYLLNKPITNYRFLMIFGAGYHKVFQKFVQRNGVLVDVSDLIFVDYMSTWSVVFQKGASISGTFTDSQTFRIRNPEVANFEQEWEYTTVRTIVGIY